MARLRIEDVHKRFGANHVLKGIDLELEDGEFLVLVGPSGCGKSTLLNLIAGLETISSGRIIIGDRVVNNVHPKDRNIAMVFQSYALYPTKTVRDNVTFGLKTRGIPRARQEEALKSVTELLHIDELLDRKPGKLSGGQRQRVAMGRALVRNPDLFLFDEPLSNLDAKLRIEMRTEIKKLHQRLGKTIVYVTHDQIEAMTLASRIAVMDNGHIRQLADPDTIYNEPDDLFVAGFMGSPPMNILPGRLVDGRGLAVEVAMQGVEPTRFPIPERLRERAKPHIGQDIILGLRPETITAASDDDQNDQHFVFERAIEVVEPTGADTLLIFDLAGIEATARVHPEQAVTPGTLYRFAVDMDKAKLFDVESGRHI